MMMRIFGKWKIFKQIKHIFLLLRPFNLLLVALTAYLTWSAAIGGVFGYINMSLHMSPATFAWLAVSLVLISAGGYVINDYYDQQIDHENKPQRQIVGKHISSSAAMVIYGVVTLAGLFAGTMAAIDVENYHLIMLQAMFALALWFYSQNLKYTAFWGNFVISISTAFVVIIVWLFEFFAMVKQIEIIHFRERELMNTIILGYAAFAFFATFLREMIKDKEDEQGDRRLDVKSIAVSLSNKGFRILSSILVLINLAMLVAAQIFLFKIELAYAGWFVLLLEIIILYIGWLILKAGEKEDYSNLSFILKGYMAAGILSMQVLYISW